MKHKMTEMTGLVFFAILMLHGSSISTAKPLDAEDVASLLPPTPRDKNETIAAVVQDPVIQDAVHQTASNSSLNGLVVKRKVYILPANDPNKIISAREHILVVPTENLEDVRKNITETKQAEAALIESSSVDNRLFAEGEQADDYVPQGDSTPGFRENDGAPGQNAFADAGIEQIPVNGDRKIESDFLEQKLSQRAPLPEEDSRKVAVPIVAVIDPSSVNNGKVDTPIVAILPNQLSGNTVDKQVQFLKDNSDKIQEKTQNYIDRSSLTVNPDYWKTSTLGSEIAIVPSTQETMPVSLLPDGSSNLLNEELILAPVAVPRWGIVAPLFPDHDEYPRAAGDMDVAEDIIFRPLFRYRQESQARSRYRDEYSNRRYYDYPRRSYYRSQYDDY